MSNVSADPIMQSAETMTDVSDLTQLHQRKQRREKRRGRIYEMTTEEVKEDG